MRHRTLITFALLAITSIAIASDVGACPNCKDTVANGSADTSETGESANGLSAGFNTSIYVMLSAFVGVLGFVGLTLYKGVRVNAAPKAKP